MTERSGADPEVTLPDIASEELLALGGQRDRLIRALAEATPVGAAILDRELRYRWVNGALAEMNGLTRVQHIGRRPRDLLGELGAGLERRLARIIVEDVELVNHRYAGTRPGAGGNVGHWMGSFYPLHDAAGRVVAVGAMVNDVTEQERSAERERQFLAGLVRVTHTIAVEASEENVFSTVAEEAARTLEVDGAVVARFRPGGIELVGRWGHVVRPTKVGPNGVLPATTTPLTEQVRRTGRPHRLTGQDPDALGFRRRVAAPIIVGDTLWGAIKAGSPSAGSLPPDAEARLARFAELVGLAVANAEEHRRLVEQATRDPLTGLYNRHSFDTRLVDEVERARRHGTSFSLALLDLDYFKSVNDEHGHDVGDAVLIEVAERLGQEARAEDLIARIGGEEFAWIMPAVDSDRAWVAAQRARERIGALPFPGVGRLTISAGVCDFAEAHDDDSLFRLADRALYYAKAQGRDRCARWAAGEPRLPAVA